LAPAASTAAAPPGTASQRARTGRPSGSDTTIVRQMPPSAACTISAVPSPPSATGARAASIPARANPAAMHAAASTAERTPLRLAGDASAGTFGLAFGQLLDRLFRS